LNENRQLLPEKPPHSFLITTQASVNRVSKSAFFAIFHLQTRLKMPSTRIYWCQKAMCADMTVASMNWKFTWM